MFLSSKGPATATNGFGLGLFALTDISNAAGCSKPVFKQLHTFPAYDEDDVDEMFLFSNRRGWWIVGETLDLDGDEEKVLFRNRTEPGSDIVPTSGWEVASAQRFESDPTMTATPFKEVSEHICSYIKI